MDTTLKPDGEPTSSPKRLLSIDGGGLMGLIPAEALVEMERQLDCITGNSMPIGRRFDLIGGTSTGAILAAGLAMGISAVELRDFYLQYGKEIFTKVWPPECFWHKYSSKGLQRRLKEKFGPSTTLGSDRLGSLVMITTKNVTHGTTWFFTNNPNGTYYNVEKDMLLWEVVRASTAAPTYFPPQKLTVRNKAGQVRRDEFVDGGVTSYNNPSLQVFLEAVLPRYGLGWQTGVDNLLLMSLGTGFNTLTIPAGAAAGYQMIDWAQYIIPELMGEANLQQNMLLHVIGRVPEPPQVAAKAMQAASASQAEAAATQESGAAPDNAVAALIAAQLGRANVGGASLHPDAAKLLTYQRITVSLTRKRLDGLGLTDIDAEKVSHMDAADQLHNLQRIGIAVATEQVHMDGLKRFFL